MLLRNPATPALLLILTTLGCAAPATEAGRPAARADSARGVLSGVVTRGPGCPAESAAEECRPMPAEGSVLAVRSAAAGSAVRAVAAGDGSYRLELGAGRYRVDLEPQGIETSKDLPVEVEIVGGRETRLDVRIDTGVR